MINLEKSVWNLTKSIFKSTCCKRWFCSISNSLNTSNININTESFKKLKCPESMFVLNNHVASK